MIEVVLVVMLVVAADSRSGASPGIVAVDSTVPIFVAVVVNKAIVSVWVWERWSKTFVEVTLTSTC